MKYILDINERKYIIKCEHYYHVTHGGDCCSNENINCNNHCKIELEILNKKSFEYKWRVLDNDEVEELMDRIDTKDLTWATQNLQSDNVYKKVVAKYLLDN